MAKRPKQTLAVFAFGLLLIWARPALGQVTIDAGRGPVTVHVPTGYNPSNPAPLLILLHGYSQTGPGIEQFTGIGAAAEAAGMLWAAPDGLVDPLGYQYWNATQACCAWYTTKPADDSTYLRHLIELIKAQLNVAQERVHVFGYSNGGYMAYRLACDHAETIASIVSLAGNTWYDPTQCTPSDSVHVLQIHGDMDQWVLYGGGIEFGGDPYPAAPVSVSTWAGYNGCASPGQTSLPNLDLDASVPGAETSILLYESQCQPGGSAALWTMQGVDHFPNFTTTFAPTVIQWFLSHPNPGGWSDMGNGLAGSLGVPQFQPSGTMVSGDTVTLAVTGALANAPAALIIGYSMWNHPFGGGLVGPTSNLICTGLQADGLGDLALSVAWPPSIPFGTDVYFQYWFDDAGGVAGYSATTTWQGVTP